MIVPVYKVVAHMKSRPVIVALVASLLSVAACGGTSSGPGGGGSDQSFTVLVTGDGGLNYDPQTNAAPSSGEFKMPVFDTLVHEDATGVITPGLAKEWQFSKDLKTLTLTLRDGLTFQDGAPLDGAAVKANIVRGQTGSKSVIADQLGVIASVDVPAASSVVLTLKSPTGSLLGFFAGPAGMMASPTAWKNPDYATHPVGAGPWQVSSDSKPGSDMVYTAFKGYWDTSAQKVPTVHVRQGAESTFVPALSGKSAQAVTLTGSPQDAKTLSDAGLPVKKTGTTYLHLMYLSKSGVFADPKVRQALSLAIDRKAICDSLLGGACEVTGQPLAPGSWAYDKSAAVPQQDIERAKQLLTEAGHPDGFAFKAVVSSSGVQLQSELSAIQQMLAKVNITVSTTPMPVAQLLPALGSGQADAYYSVNTGGADPAIPMTSMTAPAYNPGSYKDGKFTTALADANRAVTQQDRATAYQKASAAYQASTFNVVILNQDLQYATAKGVTGLTPRDPLILDTRGASAS